jgi:hypothetical protein
VKRLGVVRWLAALLTVICLGCGGNVVPSINSGKDRPKPAQKNAHAQPAQSQQL